MTDQTQYPPSAASLFSSHARTVTVPPLTLWAWCPTIGERVEMLFLRDEGNREVYSCPCGAEHSFAVR